MGFKFGPDCNCCGGTFYCETCGTGDDLIPGCGTITLSGAVFSGCRDTTLCDDYFNGSWKVQAVTDSPASSQCEYVIKNPCGCSAWNYGYNHKMGGPTASTSRPSSAAKIGFVIDVGASLYSIWGLNDLVFGISGTSSSPADTKSRAASDACDDFPLTWLNVPALNNANIVQYGCGPIDFSLATFDIAFSETGCDESSSASCQSATGCTWGGTGYGWCKDRAPDSYNKKINNYNVTVPNGWNNDALNGGTFDVPATAQTGTLATVSNPTADIYEVKISDLGTVQVKGGAFGPTQLFSKTAADYCGNNGGYDCDDLGGTYTGAHVNVEINSVDEV